MNTLAPLFRHSVGFDRFDDWLETALRSDQSNGYPPYDIIRESDGTYRVVMAVAGFSRADLDITNLAPESLDLTSTDAGLVGWLNSCSDGTHLYLCPRGSIGNPNLARVLLSDFSTVEHFDLSTASLNSDWGACFVDAAAGHVYYVPQTGNYAMRVSTSSFQLSGSSTT